MKRTFIYLPPYEKQARKRHVTDGVERDLENFITEKPDRGVLVVGTGGIRKIRVGDALRNVGKSGSFRFFYLDFEHVSWTFVLWVIRKGESENISQSGKNALRELARKLAMEVAYGKK